MRTGLKRGMTVPRATLEGYEGTITAHVLDDPAKSVFWAPFEKFPSTIPEAQRERLRQAGRKAVMEGAVAGYREFLDFFRKEYLPNARTTLGASELPERPGLLRAADPRSTRRSTSTPEEIHKIGLGEVERISQRDERRDAAGRLPGRLRGVPQVPAHRSALLRQDARGAARAGVLDRQADRRQAAVAVQDPAAPAVHRRAGAGGHRAQVHLRAATSRRRRASLAAGHLLGQHLRSWRAGRSTTWRRSPSTRRCRGTISRSRCSRELEDLPNFRRFSYISAFGEGWGLYSEWLGLEAGFYTDPYSNFGRLTYEMWRACRLVVDTGIHAMGWTRQQAHRLPGDAHGAAAARGRDRDRPLHLLAGTGALLQARRAEDQGAAQARRAGARRALRRARVPRRGARQRLGAPERPGVERRPVDRPQRQAAAAP